jgi:hypothetical protein
MALSKEWKAGLISGGVGLGVLIAVIWYMKNDTAAKEKDVAAIEQFKKNYKDNATDQAEDLQYDKPDPSRFKTSGGKRTKRRSNKSRVYKKGSQKK